MNYRHHFHAGNFADLVKHALLLDLIRRLKALGRPVTVLDTHAGAGLYGLDADPVRKSGEAEAGILRLAGEMPPPAPLADLLAAVRGFNAGGALAVYPGSPALALRALGPGDRLIACELRSEEARDLAANLKSLQSRGGPEAVVRPVDGYDYAATLRPDAGRSLLVLIDPPFEQGDEYDRVVEAAARLLALKPRPVIAIWAPIKDLETLDSLVRRLETLPGAAGYVAQTRLRPLSNPMKMNGCVMIVLGPADNADFALEASQAVARLCGEGGAAGRVEMIGG